jgi:hypothetical protein
MGPRVVISTEYHRVQDSDDVSGLSAEEATVMLSAAVGRDLFGLPKSDYVASTSIGETTVVLLADGDVGHVASRGPAGTAAVRQPWPHARCCFHELVDGAVAALTVRGQW